MIVTNSRSGGGAERSMNLLAQKMYELGSIVLLVSINEGPEDLIKPKCENINFERKLNSNLTDTLRIAIKLRKIVEERNIDCVILNCDLPELCGIFLSSKRILIVVEHTSRPFFNRRLLGIFIRIILKIKGVHFFGVSERMKVWPFGSEMEYLLRNPVDPKLVSISYGNVSAQASSPRLVFIGRFSEEKNPILFVDIAQKTKLNSIMFGTGPLLEEIKSRNVAKLELAGYVDNPWRFCRPGDIVIITSDFEGDGLVVVEALANNLPILLADNVDLRRFNLPEINYAKTTSQFCSQVSDYLLEKIDLKISEATREEILGSRNPVDIAKSFQKKISQIES